MMSPGSRPGTWSPSSWKVIFCPSFMPARSTHKAQGVRAALGVTLLHVQPRVTFIQVHAEDFLLPHNLAAVAGEAAVPGPDPLALALALGTHGLDLLDHAGPQLVDANFHARAVALGAPPLGPLPHPTACAEGGRGSPSGAGGAGVAPPRPCSPSLTPTLAADDVLLQGQLPCGAVVQILQ